MELKLKVRLIHNILRQVLLDLILDKAIKMETKITENEILPHMILENGNGKD